MHQQDDTGSYVDTSGRQHPRESTGSILAARPRGIQIIPNPHEKTLTLLLKPGADEQIFGNWAVGFERTHPGSWQEIIVDITSSRLLNSTFYSGLVILHQDFPGATVRLQGATPRIAHTLKILCLDGLIECSLRQSA
jgi:hypothetical protein